MKNSKPEKTIAILRRIALVALPVAALLATACKGDQTPPAPSPLPSGGATVEFSIGVSPLFEIVSGDLSQSQTKSTIDLSLASEQRIYNLWVVQFNNSGTLVGTPQYQTVSSSMQSGSNVKLSVDVTAGTDQSFYFIANTNNSALLDATNCATVSTLNTTALTLSQEFKPDDTSVGIPMLGVQTFATVTDGMALTGVTVDRLMAKVRLQLKNSYVGFTINSVQLKNVPQHMFFKTQPALSSNNPSAASGFFDCVVESAGTADGTGHYNLTWYTPENLRAPKAGTTADLSAADRTLNNTDDQVATYIEISGKDLTRGREVTYRLLLGTTSANGSGNDFNLKRNFIYTTTFELKGSNPTDSRITIQGAQANSFMVTPGGSVTFDAGIRGNETGVATLSPLSMAIVWQDNASLLRAANMTYSSSTRICTVTPMAGQSGNALVAAYDGFNGTGNILWSWHIWVTDYKPTTSITTRTANTAYTVTGGQVHTYGTQFQAANGVNRTIMDRNLGATKDCNTTIPSTSATATGTYGMMYQWGRKDPFPPAITVTGTNTSITLYNTTGTAIPAAQAPVYNTSATASVATSILTPTTLYRVGIDWMNTPADATLLWDPAGKTVYDPCPKGWRVPASEACFGDFTNNSGNNGTFQWYESGVWTTNSPGAQSAENGDRYVAGTTKAWYPATGWLEGFPRYAGSYCQVWASSSYLSGALLYGGGFQTNYDHVTLQINNNVNGSATASPVRCVQE